MRFASIALLLALLSLGGLVGGCGGGGGGILTGIFVGNEAFSGCTIVEVDVYLDPGQTFPAPGSPLIVGGPGLTPGGPYIFFGTVPGTYYVNALFGAPCGYIAVTSDAPGVPAVITVLGTGDVEYVRFGD